MKEKKRWLLFVLTTMLLFTSCAMQQRRYNKGFYVDWFHKAPKTKKVANAANEQNVAKRQVDLIQPIKIKIEEISNTINTPDNLVNYATAISKKRIIPITNYGFTTQGSDTALCDLIIMENGDFIDAVMVDVGDNLIRYRHCDDPEGTLFVLNQTDILMVKYANGTILKFKHAIPNEYTGPAGQGNNAAATSLIFGIFGLFLFGITAPLAIIFALVAKAKMKHNPNSKKARNTANLGLALGILEILGLGLLILFVVFL